MKKMYVVQLMDKEDGGHLLDEAFFDNANDARKEFLRIKAQMFNGYHYDKPGRHFTCYDNDDYEISLNVVKPGKFISYFNKPYMNNKPFVPSLFRDQDAGKNDVDDSVDGTFEYWTNQASKRWNFDNGFKYIYDNISRTLGHVITKCIYTKEDRPYQPAAMTYCINTSDHGEVVIDVQRDNPKGEYSYTIVG